MRLHERATVVVLEQGSLESVSSTPELDVELVWWWGRISPLDTQTFVTDMLRSQGSEIDVAMITELARFDLLFAEELARHWDRRPDSLQLFIRRYGRAVHAQPLDGDWEQSMTRREPTIRMIDAWSAGFLDEWDLSRTTRHLVVEPRLEEIVRERLWRAQIRTLYPEIEFARQRVARWVDANRWLLTPGHQGADIIALEVGQLSGLIRSTPALSVHTQWRELADWLRSSRNSLAHLEPLTAAEIRTGRRLMSVVGADVEPQLERQRRDEVI